MKIGNRQFRAVTYFPNGQRYEGWLPAGDYTPGDCVPLTVGRGSADRADAREVWRDGSPGERWYIGETLYQQHLAEPATA